MLIGNHTTTVFSHRPVLPAQGPGGRSGNGSKTTTIGFARLAVAVLALALVAMTGGHARADADLKAFARGPMAAFIAARAPKPVPDIAFRDGEGKELGLDDWRGRVVLINLWATWCAPCRREMPSLDALQADLGGDDFEVVAISVDRKGVAASGKFLEVTGARHLGLYVDESFKVARDLRAPGLPVTVLVDREGREVGRVTGPAEWDSDEAKALIRAVIAGGTED